MLICPNIQIILGGMVYDDDLERGVRKKYLNEPYPQKVELARNATLADVFQKAKQLYFRWMLRRCVWLILPVSSFLFKIKNPGPFPRFTKRNDYSLADTSSMWLFMR